MTRVPVYMAHNTPSAVAVSVMNVKQIANMIAEKIIRYVTGKRLRFPFFEF